MDFPALIVIATVLGALFAMARSLMAPELALCSALAVFVFAGIVTPQEALQGFSSPSLHTVALLFVVSEGVRRSGALEVVGDRLLGRPSDDAQAQLRLMLPAAALSSVMNNTPVVALFLPVVRRWARRAGLTPSRLLIPLSYAAILGGTCTLVGSGTNLLIRAFLPENLQHRFGMFTIGAVGLPATIVGMLVLLVFGRRLLPVRPNDDEVFSDPRTFTTEVTVEPDGPLVGKRLADVRIGEAALLTPVEIDRGGTVLPAPSMDETLRAGDRLVLAGAAAATAALHEIPGLLPAHERLFENASDGRRRIFELVVSRRCPLVGRQAGDGSFRARYNAAVLAVARHGEAVQPRSVGGWTLEVGDSLLIEADRGFASAHQSSGDFIVVTGHKKNAPAAVWHPFAGLAVMLLVLGAAGAGVVSPFVAAVAAVTVVLVARLVPWSAVFKALDGRVLLTIAAALGVGVAIQKAGVADQVAQWIVEAGGGGAWMTLALVYLCTVVFTELVTNNAAAAIMIPLALATADRLGANPMPFVVAVAVAASASFMTPIGYQTNLMVYGPGGYRFSDFARIGSVVSLFVAAVTLILAPMVWPF